MLRIGWFAVLATALALATQATAGAQTAAEKAIAAKAKCVFDGMTQAGELLKKVDNSKPQIASTTAPKFACSNVSCLLCLADACACSQGSLRSSAHPLKGCRICPSPYHVGSRTSYEEDRCVVLSLTKSFMFSASARTQPLPAYTARKFASTSAQTRIRNSCVRYE